MFRKRNYMCNEFSQYIIYYNFKKSVFRMLYFNLDLNTISGQPSAHFSNRQTTQSLQHILNVQSDQLITFI